MSEGGAAAETTEGPVGLGGWLILPIIALIVTPLRGVFHLASYSDLFGSMQGLTAGQSGFLVTEFIGNLAVLLILPIILIVLLLRKSASFPRLFIAWAAIGLAFIVLDIAAAQIFFGDVLAATAQGLLDAETMRELFRSIITAAIWIPSMRISRRVSNTFIN